MIVRIFSRAFFYRSTEALCFDVGLLTI